MPKRHRPGGTATRVVSHIEEIVLAAGGHDAFEIVFAVAAARAARTKGRTVVARIASAAKAVPELAIAVPPGTPAELLDRVDGLLGPVLAPGAVDAIFESLVPRLAKGEKGQFFTPRHVVDFVVRALEPRARELVVDPACGSGAFLAHAHALAKVKTRGCDVDPRAVRIARLLALADHRDPATIAREDGLGALEIADADVVATNPPFAGRAPAAGFAIADVVRTPERDVLFLERSLDVLAPGGRLGIVLPYNKGSGVAFAAMRRWLFERARILGVIGLPRETFLPHTSQRTFVLLAKKRRAGEAAKKTERTFFAVSERAGKNAAGERQGEDDLADVLAELAPFLAAEGLHA